MKGGRGCRRAASLAALLTCATPGCDDGRRSAIRADVHVVTSRDDALVPPAMRRLAEQGAQVVGHIETALHGADKRGRLRLVRVLGDAGAADAVELLRHWALHDPETEVRDACETLLSRWSVQKDERAERARRARTWLGKQRQAGHGPLVTRP